MKNSKVLDGLIEKAKKVGGRPNCPFTAERFLVAIIDEILNESSDSKNDEIIKTDEIISGAIDNLSATREILIKHIQDAEKYSFLDELNMKDVFKNATKLAEEAKVPEIDAPLLLLCVFSNPSKTVRTILESKESEDLSGSEKSEEPEEPETPEKAKEEISAWINDIKRIKNELQAVVRGQDNAIKIVTSGLFQAKMLSALDKSREKPFATFLFAGPPGVGKTFLAEKLAASLKMPFKRFDMSGYSDNEATMEFCGFDKAYRGAKAGNVTSFIDENPKCILLFDEIEKAHISVIHLFLQMLDAGRIYDNYYDKKISLKDVIIILTTNAGKQLYNNSETGNFSDIPRKVIIKALEKDVNPETNIPFFPEAICSRFASGNVVMFNHVEAHDLRKIAKETINKQATGFEAKTGVNVTIEDATYTALLFSEGSTADARTIKSRSETFLNDEFYELFRLVDSEKVKTGVSDLENICISVDLTGAENNVLDLFELKEKPKALVFSTPEIVEKCESSTDKIAFCGVQKEKEAEEKLKAEEFDFVLLDMNFGITEDTSSLLNLEDVDSPARDFFKFLKEHRDGLPVYIIGENKDKLSKEETESFLRQGVRDVVYITDEARSLTEVFDSISISIHHQKGMLKLARENKIVSFETSQNISEDGKNAKIRLFDFNMVVAVDAEDSKNILSSVSKPDVQFEDVIGAEDAKKELKYFVEYLKNPKKYIGTGVKPPKGVIFYGPPGTGKTMLAKAMACESGVTFIAAEGNQFLKKYVGEGPETVHELFRTARKYAPSILFIDEIDAIAKERKGGEFSNGVEATLTAFLAEMDGFAVDPSKPVFVMAATNFDVEPGKNKSLDPALMRRFDRRIYVDLPNKVERIRFLNKKISENRALDITEEKIDNISLRATGMSLAELDSVVELALRSAIREGNNKVTDAVLEEAFETFNSGDVKKWDESQLERVARHEAGHALLCYLSGEKPSYLTIVARGNHGGYMQRAEQEGKAIYTKDELLSRIRTSLGGRAAEIAYYGKKDGISTGASGDLESATLVAQQIICSYGMDDDFGLAVVNNTTASNGEMSVEVRESVNRILKEQMEEAVRLIEENKDKIDSLVEELMSKNHLNSKEIEEVITRSSGK